LRSNLTNLRMAVRYALARLTASGLILLLAWLFLYLIIDGIPEQGRSPSILELGLAASFFTVLFNTVNRYVPYMVRRILLRNERHRSGLLADDPMVTAALPDPAAFGELLLRLT